MSAALEEVLADSRIATKRDLRESHAARARDNQLRH